MAGFRYSYDTAAAGAALPPGITFMDMLQAADTASLGIGERWGAADAASGLAAPVGLDASGRPLMLDLHERAHGPHALVAGTTGSGKSEFLVAWILSMCLSYPPDEVAFLLIDYKGGGLAGAFDGEVRLPHLQGTVTNLDGAAIARSLVSLTSELRRRQDLLGRARAAAGGDNVDVYGYLRLYREGKVSEPCPHLFVVADEFAELKDQQPEFMDGLVSAARIGRSLGVHLVLATQKPDGVVSQQIWSNSRLKVCLKVAEAADSKAMVRRPDAAELEEAGRFCMLVGYNEHYAVGQAAWAGAPYVPVPEWRPARDEAVCAVSPTGRVLASARPAPAHAAQGSQLVAVLAELAAAARRLGHGPRQLWLDPVPAHITVDEIAAKYAGQLAGRDSWELDPVVGELDDPANQSQRALTLPLSREGNAVVYGSAGSGKSVLAAGMLAGCIASVPPGRLSTYIVDLGGESLTAFKEAPQVGDVLTSADPERVSNLLKVLAREVAERRTAFGGAAASLAEAHERLGVDLPHVLVVINNVVALSDIVPDSDDALMPLLREGPRYGIHFLILANGAGDVRYKMTSLIKLVLCLSLADEGQYVQVLGSMRGVAAPRGLGRGLVKVGDSTLTFQCAFPERAGEDPYQAACVIAEQAKNRDPQGGASAIPVLPEVLHLHEMPSGDFNGLAIGIKEDDFAPLSFDYLHRAGLFVSATQTYGYASFIRAVIEELDKEKDVECVVVDSGEVLEYRERVFKDSSAALAEIERVIGEEGDNEAVLVLADASRDIADDDTRALLDSVASRRGMEGLTVIVGTPSASLTTLKSQEWCSRFLGLNPIVWVGEGFSDQFTIKASNPIAELRCPREGSAGFYIEKGRAQPVRLPFFENDDSAGGGRIDGER